MIKYYVVHKTVVVKAIDLYEAFGRDRQKFYIWKRRYITNNCVLDRYIDYWPVDSAAGPSQALRDFYLSLTLAKSICISERTIVAKQILKFIDEKIEKKIDRKIKRLTNVII